MHDAKLPCALAGQGVDLVPAVGIEPTFPNSGDRVWACCVNQFRHAGSSWMRKSMGERVRFERTTRASRIPGFKPGAFDRSASAPWSRSGASSRARTCDARLFRPALYPLSYRGNVWRPRGGSNSRLPARQAGTLAAELRGQKWLPRFDGSHRVASGRSTSSRASRRVPSRASRVAPAIVLTASKATAWASPNFGSPPRSTVVRSPAQLLPALSIVVSVDGFEPPTSCSQSRRATNCATRSSFGGTSRDRTDNLLLARQALSQLSYGPMKGDGGC